MTSWKPKVCILIDNNSLSLSSHGHRIDFAKLQESLLAGRDAAVQRFYCGEIGTENREKFYHSLRMLGIRVVISRIVKHSSRSAQFDPTITQAILCNMAWDLCELSENRNFSTFVVVTKSVELADVIAKVRERGVDVEIASFEPCSESLRSRATQFRLLPMESLIYKRTGLVPNFGGEDDSISTKVVPKSRQVLVRGGVSCD